MERVKNTWQRKPSVIFISLLLIMIVCLALTALFVRSGIFNRFRQVADVQPAEPAVDVSPEATTVADIEEDTPTPTKVIPESDGALPTNTPTFPAMPVNTATPTHTPTALRLSRPSPTPTMTPTAEQIGPIVANVLQNGGFERGIDSQGVGLGWQAFTNGAAKYIFSAEGWPQAVHEGKFAQRITIYEAAQADRYAGIYQTVDVMPGKPYELILHGQIRSKAGSTAVSQYGYRMQYAIDYYGQDEWQTISDDDWVELPWDEQPLDGGSKHLTYQTTIVPQNSKMTLFIRAWNKWHDPTEAQYTLDTLSLVGPARSEALIDQPLPTTGDGSAGGSFVTDPRFWASLLFLAFIIGNTIWRNKRRRLVR